MGLFRPMLFYIQSPQQDFKISALYIYFCHNHRKVTVPLFFMFNNKSKVENCLDKTKRSEQDCHQKSKVELYVCNNETYKIYTAQLKYLFSNSIWRTCMCVHVNVNASVCVYMCMCACVIVCLTFSSLSALMNILVSFGP